MYLKRIFLAVSILIVGCSSDSNVPKEMDEPIEKKGQLSKTRSVGLDEDGAAVIEEKVDASDKLRILEMNNNRLKDDLDIEYSRLERCRTDMAHPALGGDGKYKDLPEVDDLDLDTVDADQLRINDEGELKMVGRRKFMDKFKLEQKRAKSIRRMTKTVKKYRKDCEIDMSAARQKVGLPGSRYKSKGHYDANGQWIKIHKAEKNIDDAFQIKKILEKE